MMKGTHYVRQCAHSVIIEQCACPDANKPVLLGACPSNCPHRDEVTDAAERAWIRPIVVETPVIAAIREAHDL